MACTAPALLQGLFIKLITVFASLKLWSPASHLLCLSLLSSVAAFISFTFTLLSTLMFFPPLVLSCLSHAPCISFSSLSRLLCMMLSSPLMCSDPSPIHPSHQCLGGLLPQVLKYHPPWPSLTLVSVVNFAPSSSGTSQCKTPALNVYMLLTIWHTCKICFIPYIS